MGSAATPENDDLVVSSTGADQTTKDTVTAPDEKAPANPTVNSGEEEIENPSRPKGLRFVILFISILAGDFFVGYVCNIMNIPSSLPFPASRPIR